MSARATSANTQLEPFVCRPQLAWHFLSRGPQHRNIVYGARDRSNTLDVFNAHRHPTNNSSVPQPLSPVILFIHGGTMLYAALSVLMRPRCGQAHGAVASSCSIDCLVSDLIRFVTRSSVAQRASLLVFRKDSSV